MKKTLLLIIIMLGILPCFDHGEISIYHMNEAIAQKDKGYGCKNPRGDGDTGDGVNFFQWLGGILGDIDMSDTWEDIGDDLNDVGGFIKKIGKSIANFFDDLGNAFDSGEQFSEELDDYGWTGGSGFYSPEGDPSENGDWDDFWNDPDFNPELNPFEEDIVNNLQDYYDMYYNSNGGNPPSPQNPKYYITVGYFPKRYYNTDSIFVMSSIDTAALILRNENSPYTVQMADVSWKQNNVVKSVNSLYCKPDATVGQSTIRVDSAETTTLIQNPYEVYTRPTIIFERGIPYDGEYGFDDSSHKHDSVRHVAKYIPGIEIARINNADYVVPWMSLLHGQQATIGVKKLNLSSKAGKDPGFQVNLIPSNTSIKLNGQNQLNLNYDALNNLNVLNVYAEQWNIDSDSLKIVGSVYAITNSGDTIGKLNISCAIPVLKKLKIIYVNTGTGFLNAGNHTRQAILDQLNIHSHNQLMRQWVLDTSFSHINLDTMDLTNEYLVDTASFHNPYTIGTKIRGLLFQKKGIGVATLNPGIDPASSDTGKVHVVFVLNYPANGNTSGITDFGGTLSCLFSTSKPVVFSHEMGHILHLAHTFPETNNLGVYNANYNIPKYSTQNIMDYELHSGDVRNMFSFFQWVDVF